MILGRQHPCDQDENGNKLFTQKRISHTTATKGPENLCKNTPLLQKKKAFITLFHSRSSLLKIRASIHIIKEFHQENGLQNKAAEVGDKKSEELDPFQLAVRLVTGLEKNEEHGEFEQASPQKKEAQKIPVPVPETVDGKKDPGGHQDVDQVALCQLVCVGVQAMGLEQQDVAEKKEAGAQEQAGEKNKGQAPKVQFLIFFNCCTSR